MNNNLNTLRTQILEQLKARNFVVFPGYRIGPARQSAAFWDAEQHPDHAEFIAVAEAVGARIVVLYANEFGEDRIDQALEMLEESELEPEEARALDGRLRKMRSYAGFTCSIELSFDHAGRCYVYEISTDWYNEFTDIQMRIDEAYSESIEPEDEDEDDDGPPYGSLYSKN